MTPDRSLTTSAPTRTAYYTTKDELNFTVTINADGYAAQTIQVKKDAGGAEAPD
ncbi:MAG: hypothetical protein OIN66_12740 [Candidatus Methanoperedens sp.]|nr:hypothetical protein [Candidatus Methanoperedens sp.]